MRIEWNCCHILNSSRWNSQLEKQHEPKSWINWWNSIAVLWTAFHSRNLLWIYNERHYFSEQPNVGKQHRDDFQLANFFQRRSKKIWKCMKFKENMISGYFWVCAVRTHGCYRHWMVSHILRLDSARSVYTPFIYSWVGLRDFAWFSERYVWQFAHTQRSTRYHSVSITQNRTHL